jgi:thiamine-phosphate pyrophosphorylase
MAKKTDQAAPVPNLYLFSPRVTDAGPFAQQLPSVLDAAEVSCLLLNVPADDPGAAKKMIQSLAQIAQPRGVALLVDCETRLVARSGADGIHLRGSGEALEASVSEAVQSLKPDHIVGVGGLRTRHDAMTAGEQDIDYVMFGEPSNDAWTPPIEELVEKVSWWSEIFNVPCVAFAARLEDIPALVEAGADFIALGEAVWGDPRGPVPAIKDAAASLRIALGTS